MSLSKLPGAPAVTLVEELSARPSAKVVPFQCASDPSVRMTYSPVAHAAPVPIPSRFRAARFVGTSLSKLPGVPAVATVDGLVALPASKVAPFQNASVPSPVTT